MVDIASRAVFCERATSGVGILLTSGQVKRRSGWVGGRESAVSVEIGVFGTFEKAFSELVIRIRVFAVSDFFRIARG
jgi:hypothetical protein